MTALLLKLIGELLLLLVVAELAGWLPNVADAILRCAAHFYPEKERASQLSEWRDHLAEQDTGNKPLFRVLLALVMLGSALLAGWYRHGRPSLNTYLTIYRLENALRAAKQERQEVERLRHNRIGRLTLIGKRTLALLGIWSLAFTLFSEALLLGSLFPNSDVAVSVALLVIMYAMYLSNVRGVVSFTGILDAGFAAVMASVYTRYRPRADRRIEGLEKRLHKLRHKG